MVVVYKSSGSYKEITCIGVSKDQKEISDFVTKGKEWIRKRELSLHPELDFEGADDKAKADEVLKRHLLA